MRKYIIIGVCTLIVLFGFNSCKKYLDVVPDNVATLDNAFATRIEAQKFLFTCYSWMPQNGNVDGDPAMLGGDEMWLGPTSPYYYFNIAKGYQNVVSPYGANFWTQFYQGIRDCNIFLENIDKVPGIRETEKEDGLLK